MSASYDVNATPATKNNNDAADDATTSIDELQIVAIKRSSLPLLPTRCPVLYCFHNEVKTFRKKYDHFNWCKGSNYKGVTGYRCIVDACPAKRFTWICRGLCRTSESKNHKCCTYVNENHLSSGLFVSYDEKHTYKGH